MKKIKKKKPPYKIQIIFLMIEKKKKQKILEEMNINLITKVKNIQLKSVKKVIKVK